METKDILKTLRKNKGYSTMQDFCSAANISFSTYQNYETGKRLPTAEILMKIADFYGVTTDYLLGRDEKTADPIETLASQFGLNSASKAILAAYLYMDDKERSNLLSMVKRFADAASEHEKENTAQEIRRILKYDMLHINKASAGTGYDLTDRDQWRSISIYDCPEAHEADFAVEVDGDSMSPEYNDGDIVFVKEDRDVPVGKVGLFRVGDCGYIKERGEGELISYNTNYKNIPLKDTDNDCIGRVIGVAELPE